MSPKDPLQSSEEGVTFLQPNGIGAPDATDGSKKDQQKTNSSEGSSCCKCCGWKCCGIATLIVIVILGATVLGLYLWWRSMTGNGPSMADSQEWENKLLGQDSVTSPTGE